MVIIIFASVLPVYADIYMYIDTEGVLHFTNTPTSTKYKIYIKEKLKRSSNTHSTDKYDRLIEEASKRHGVLFPLIKAVIKAESDFDPRAVSKAGALGLMQIMPKNVNALKISDPFNPLENIMGGTRYFKQLIDKYEGKLQLALAAYNAGPNTVDYYNGIPPLKETENYVKRVMKYFYLFKQGL
ncbi:MAG: lytic transglycosylase domain-containing protein [Desulfobacterales bacterium]